MANNITIEKCLVVICTLLFTGQVEGQFLLGDKELNICYLKSNHFFIMEYR